MESFRDYLVKKTQKDIEKRLLAKRRDETSKLCYNAYIKLQEYLRKIKICVNNANSIFRYNFK